MLMRKKNIYIKLAIEGTIEQLNLGYSPQDPWMVYLPSWIALIQDSCRYICRSPHETGRFTCTYHRLNSSLIPFMVEKYSMEHLGYIHMSVGFLIIVKMVDDGAQNKKPKHVFGMRIAWPMSLRSWITYPPKKWTCPPKRDHFKRKLHFPTNIF